MPYARRAIGDEPKPLKHDFTAYDTPGRDIHEAVLSRSRARLTSALLQLSQRDSRCTISVQSHPQDLRTTRLSAPAHSPTSIANAILTSSQFSANRARH
jgi:cellulase/cellobiase CelA1